MKYINSLLKSPIVKNLSIFVSGTALAQLIVIGFQVVLRRIYSPEDFGAFALYMSVVGIVATISSFRYEQAIILPKENTIGQNILKLSILLSLITFVLLLITFVLLDNQIVSIINFPVQYQNWLYFIPISILLFSISQSFNFYLIRIKRFKLSASNKLFRRTSEGIIQSLFGMFHRSFGLFVGDIVGQLTVIVRTVLKTKDSFNFKIDLSELKIAAKRYKSFPLKNGIPSLMNALSLLLPIIIINRQFNEEVTGYFDLARMVLIIPLSLITASLSQVIFQRFSEKRNQKQSIKKEAWGIFISLIILALFFAIIIQFFGVYLFQFVFGIQWGSSGAYASILVWAFALKFVISPFNILFTAFEKIEILSIWQTFYFILILLLNYIPFVSIEHFLWAYVIIELISYSIAGLLNIGLIVKYERSIINSR